MIHQTVSFSPLLIHKLIHSTELLIILLREKKRKHDLVRTMGRVFLQSTPCNPHPAILLSLPHILRLSVPFVRLSYGKQRIGLFLFSPCSFRFQGLHLRWESRAKLRLDAMQISIFMPRLCRCPSRGPDKNGNEAYDRGTRDSCGVPERL